MSNWLRFRAVKSKLMALRPLKIIPGRNYVEPLLIVAFLSFCISVSVAPSVLRHETCNVDIAGYCCRNETLSKPASFELSCFSKDSWEDGTLLGRNFPVAAATPKMPKLSENGSMGSDYTNLAFRIKVDSATMLTVQCATAAPNIRSLLTYLKVQNVTSLIYIHCDLPQGNLSFARIFDGNLSPVNSMSLEDPLNIPNRTLRGDLFEGLSAGLRDLSIAQNVGNRSFELSDEFFKNFRSLRSLNLTASITRIPKDLLSLSNLTHLYLSGTTISKITSDAFSNLTSLDALRIYNAPITNFGSRPFSNLKMLTVLEMSGLHATEIPNDIFSGLSRLRSLKLREWANLTTIQAEAFSNTPNLKRLELGVMPLLEILPTGLFKDLLDVEEIEIDDCGLKHMPTGLWPRSARASNNLNEIRIVNSKVETLPEYFFRGNTELHRVNLERNRLQQIGRSLQKVPSLRRLNLSGNQLASISKGDFKGLNELEYLNLRRNRIEFIENGSFEKLSVLDSLILSENKLQSFDNLIKAGNEAIASIYLSNNMITSFPNIPFDVLGSFDTLQMDDNLISTFEVPLFESDDTTFYLRRNRIELILFSKFEGVKTLESGEHLFYIDENPFKCNGENSNFLRYIRGNMTADIAMFEDLENCFCSGTNQLIKEVTRGTF